MTREEFVVVCSFAVPSLLGRIRLKGKWNYIAEYRHYLYSCLRGWKDGKGEVAEKDTRTLPRSHAPFISEGVLGSFVSIRYNLDFASRIDGAMDTGNTDGPTSLASTQDVEQTHPLGFDTRCACRVWQRPVSGNDKQYYRNSRPCLTFVCLTLRNLATTVRGHA
eukprot:g694.t1